MEKNSTFTESVVDINDDGYGVIKVNGEVVFVHTYYPANKFRALLLMQKANLPSAKPPLLVALIPQGLSLPAHTLVCVVDATCNI